jgi:hypothetical protein
MMERINGIVYKIHANHNPHADHEFYVQEYPPIGGGQLKIGDILHRGSKAECMEFLRGLGCEIQ